MRVLVEDRSVGTNVSLSVVLLLANGCNTASGKTGGAGSDEFGKSAEDFALGLSDGDVQLTTEQVSCVLQVLIRVPDILLVLCVVFSLEADQNTYSPIAARKPASSE